MVSQTKLKHEPTSVITHALLTPPTSKEGLARGAASLQVFVSHAWLEGVFELADLLKRAWPPSRHLSNLRPGKMHGVDTLGMGSQVKQFHTVSPQSVAGFPMKEDYAARAFPFCTKLT